MRGEGSQEGESCTSTRTAAPGPAADGPSLGLALPTGKFQEKIEEKRVFELKSFKCFVPVTSDGRGHAWW